MEGWLVGWFSEEGLVGWTGDGSVGDVSGMANEHEPPQLRGGQAAAGRQWREREERKNGTSRRKRTIKKGPKRYNKLTQSHQPKDTAQSAAAASLGVGEKSGEGARGKKEGEKGARRRRLSARNRNQARRIFDGAATRRTTKKRTQATYTNISGGRRDGPKRLLGC